MKLNLSFLVFFLAISISLTAQRKPLKFYSKKDSTNHELFSKLLYGSMESYEDSVFQLETDSGEVELSREELRERFRTIKVYRYTNHKSQQDFIPIEEALTSNRKDTITQITIIGKGYKKIPLGILKFKSLKSLEIIDTKITKLPWLMNWSLFGMKKLEELFIHNQQNSIAFKFKKNDQLKKLYYTDNPYAPQPKGIYKLGNVELLKLVKNDFPSSSKFDFHKMKKLKELNLRGNSIQIEMLANSETPSLTKLILTDNSITKVPTSIKYFINLKELQFAENNITSDSISVELSSLKDLEMLSFYKNELSYIPPFIFELKKLTDLDLYYNNIEILPEELTKLSELKRLYLAYNRVYSLPEGIGQLDKLEELYLKNNRISYLPESIKKLDHITDFHISNNYLQAFPSCVLSYSNLEDLDISFNEIHSIPKELLELEKLKILWMKGIVFQANSKEVANDIKYTIESLQKRGVNVGLTYE